MMRVIGATLVALLAVPGALQAHELGTTQVEATFHGGRTYTIDIAVDPDALLTRLQVASGGEVLTPHDQSSRDAAIRSLSRVFIDRTAIRFDQVAVSPQFEYRPVPRLSDLAQTPSTVRLTGTIPEGARAFTFSYRLATGTFAVVARVGDDPPRTLWNDAGNESAPISLVSPSPDTVAEVATRYFALGFTHILPKGLDHILFVVGLFLLSARWRSVLLQVSAFTVAHSLTLGLTIYGVVSLPARVIEPLIALSIVYVAIENMLSAELRSWRVALVFSFGLLHGMGFAGVLRDLGLPRGDFLTALLTFNLGVEMGQLAVVALAFALVAAWRTNAVVYRRAIVQPASIAIALTGAYWTVERLF